MDRAIDGLREIFSDLEDDCKSFDENNEKKAKDIAGRIRTLLKNGDSKNGKPSQTISLLAQVVKMDIPFKDSSAPYNTTPSLSYFDLNGSISNSTIYLSGVYMGLVYKIMHGTNENGTYSFAPMFRRESLKPQIKDVSFDVWWNQRIYEDPQTGLKLSRKNLILASSEQDGFSHFDKKLKPDYAYLLRSDSLRFVINGQKIRFENNPAKNSIRQIGYEVIESFRNSLNDIIY